jgi:hypothetical protein
MKRARLIEPGTQTTVERMRLDDASGQASVFWTALIPSIKREISSSLL